MDQSTQMLTATMYGKIHKISRKIVSSAYMSNPKHAKVNVPTGT